MDDLLVLYYAICYTAGGAGLVVALIAAKSRSSLPDARFASVIASLALILVPFFVLSYLGSRGEGSPLSLALWSVSIAGESFLIACLPRFIHSLFPRSRERAIERAWILGALAAFASFPLIILFPRAFALYLVPMVLMPAAILYVVIVSLAGVLRGQPWAAVIDEGERARWLSLIKSITALSAVFLPLMAAFDFFPVLSESLGRILGIGFPPFLKAFPLFFAILSGVYIAKTLPIVLLPRTASSDAGGPEILSLLSAREAEVARLLVSGLRYRDIGDRLFISLSTVKTHVERIYRKTGARNKMELACALRARS